MIVVVGISHRTAPIEVRERSALPESEVPAFLGSLVASGEVREAFVVSTCNRVEVVAAPSQGSTEGLEGAAKACGYALCSRTAGLERHIYMHMGHRAVEHLFQVASSLDSLVVGEPQILGQLKQGFELGRKSGTVGPVLHRAFPRAVRAAKRVRTETTIGAGQVSIPSVAVELATRIFSDFRGRVVALIGAGEMGRGVAKLLADAGARILVLGRRLEAAQELAREVNGEARTMADLSEALTLADVVVSSTSSPDYVITESALRSVRRARRGRNLFLIDLAVPRDVEPSAGSLESTFLYNIDDLSQVVEGSLHGRRREAEQAQRILDEEARGFERWAEAEQATPLIKALRARFRSALEMELDKSFRGRLRDLDEGQRAAVVKMLDASLNRMLHLPTSRLRKEASGADAAAFEQMASTLDDLFSLSNVPDEAVDVATARLLASEPPAELRYGSDPELETESPRPPDAEPRAAR